MQRKRGQRQVAPSLQPSGHPDWLVHALGLEPLQQGDHLSLFAQTFLVQQASATSRER